MQTFKCYLDISKDEQAKRLEQRWRDPLKQWKTSPIDAVALEHWDDYSSARNEMLIKTHDAMAPWFVVRADHKKAARMNVIRHVLSRVDCPGRVEHLATPDPDVVFEFAPERLYRLAP